MQSRQSDGTASAALTSRTSKQVTINLESVILIENKLLRVVNSVKSLKQITLKTQNTAALNVYAAQLKEVVDICEDYWLILRAETDMFSNLPGKMFKDNVKLISQLKRAFIAKMMVMSLLGFLFSHEEFTFKDSHLRQMI